MDLKYKIEKIAPEHNQEEIKEKILEYLHARFKSAAFPGEDATNFDVIKEALMRLGLKRDEITSNFMSLKSNGWIDEKTWKSKSLGVLLTEHQYFISTKGINHFEGPSKFKESPIYDGINVTNIQGIVTIGDGNIVHYQYMDLYHSLISLGNEVRKCPDLDDVTKLNIQSDIETIKSQLAKITPNKGIIQRAWEGLKVLATINGVAGLYILVEKYIFPLIN